MPEKEIDLFFSDNAKVKAEGTYLPLCAMCQKSRLNCDNFYIREVEVPLDQTNNPDDDEVIGQVKQGDGSIVFLRLGYKIVDGVAAGIMKEENDIPIPFLCDWFTQKELG